MFKLNVSASVVDDTIHNASVVAPATSATNTARPNHLIAHRLYPVLCAVAVAQSGVCPLGFVEYQDGSELHSM
jgi:hypothetical protein